MAGRSRLPGKGARDDAVPEIVRWQRNDRLEEELPDVAKAANAVAQEAKDAGVWVFGGGLKHREEGSVVATDGPYPESKEHLGGFAVVDVPLREKALDWAAKDCRRLPLCAEGPRVRARPDRLIDGRLHLRSKSMINVGKC